MHCGMKSRTYHNVVIIFNIAYYLIYYFNTDALLALGRLHTKRTVILVHWIRQSKSSRFLLV